MKEQSTIETGARKKDQKISIEAALSLHTELKRQLESAEGKVFALYNFSMEGGSEVVGIKGMESVVQALEGTNSSTVYDIINPIMLADKPYMTKWTN